MTENEETPPGDSAQGGADQDNLATNQVSSSEDENQIGLLDSNTQAILDSIPEGGIEKLTLAQAFQGDYAHICIPVDGTAILVNNKPQLVSIPQKESELAGWNIKGDPRAYIGLVDLRWSKSSLETFIKGTSVPYPPFVYNQLKDVLNKLIDLSHEPIYADIICCWIIGTYIYRLFEAFPY